MSSNPSPYDQEVLSDKPVLYLTMGHAASTTETDQSGFGNHGAYFPRDHVASSTTLPNGELAAAFDGHGQYLEVQDDDSLSIPTTGVLTLETWMRPDAYDFPETDKDGYIHWAGKGEWHEHEYVFRMYSLHNPVDRSQRISCYAYNLSGGLGAGSYVQEPTETGEWIHFVAVYNTRVHTTLYPTGSIKLYKNGVLHDTDSLISFNITPANGEAPLRIGTRDGGSYLLGAVGKFAVYDHELPAERVWAHYNRMMAH